MTPIHVSTSQLQTVSESQLIKLTVLAFYARHSNAAACRAIDLKSFLFFKVKDTIKIYYNLVQTESIESKTKGLKL